MAEAAIYPQIPSTVWTGVWKILHDSPSRRVDENVLSVELGVQKTASKQYLKELVRLGLFAGDGSTTDLAKRWRQDGEDPAIINEILAEAYPRELLDLAPVDRLDRDKIVRWFMSEGLGRGSAQNKAATYLRVASGVSAAEIVRASKSTGAKPNNATPTRAASNGASRGRASANRTSPTAEDGGTGEGDGDGQNAGGRGGPRNGVRQPELNVNVQIHISADSSSEQIDAIFFAMRKYFDGDQAI